MRLIDWYHGNWLVLIKLNVENRGGLQQTVSEQNQLICYALIFWHQKNKEIRKMWQESSKFEKIYIDKQRDGLLILENVAVLFVRSYIKPLILTASVRQSTPKQEFDLPQCLQRPLAISLYILKFTQNLKKIFQCETNIYTKQLDKKLVIFCFSHVAKKAPEVVRACIVGCSDL